MRAIAPWSVVLQRPAERKRGVFSKPKSKASRRTIELPAPLIPATAWEFERDRRIAEM